MGKSIRVTLLSDSNNAKVAVHKSITKLNEKSFRKYSLMCTDSVSDTMQFINRKATDVIIIDADIPGFNPAMCAREFKSSKGIGVIILCSHIYSSKSVIETQISGAHDYLLLSNLNENAIECAIECALAKAETAKQLIRNYAKIPDKISDTLDRLENVSRVLLQVG